MKPNSTSLYQLIQLLSPSEKRYFKLYAQNSDPKNQSEYLKLYEAIIKLDIQSDQDFNCAKQKTPLSVAKVQLFNHILDCLHLFHRNNSLQEKLKSDEHKASILNKKGFSKEAQKIISKSLLKAAEQEFFSIYISLHQLESQLIGSNFYQKTSFEKLQERHQKLKLIIQKLENLEELNFLFNQIYKFHFQKVKSKNQEDKKQLEIWFTHPLLQDEALSLSVSAKIIFFQLNALKSFLNGDTLKASNFNLKILQLIEDQELMFDRYAQKYLAILNNYLIDCLQLGQLENLNIGLAKLKKLPTHPAYKQLKETPVQVFKSSFQLELNLMLNQGDFEGIISKEQELLSGLKKYASRLGRHSEFSFYYILMYAHFGNSDFEGCLHYTNMLLNQRNEHAAEALLVSASLVEILVHYELGNELLLSYSLVNLRKYQKRRKQFFQLEELIISTLTKLIKTPKSERHASYLKMKEDLLHLQNDHKENSLFQNFDFLAWVNAKINKESFGEAYKKNRTLSTTNK